MILVIYNPPSGNWIVGHPPWKLDPWPSWYRTPHSGPYHDELSRTLNSLQQPSRRVLPFQRGGPWLSYIVMPGATASVGWSSHNEYGPILPVGFGFSVQFTLTRFDRTINSNVYIRSQNTICSGTLPSCNYFDGINHAMITSGLPDLPGSYHLSMSLRSAAPGDPTKQVGWDFETDYEIY